MQVSDPRLKRAICEKWLEAAQANGYPYNPDYNGPTQEGVGHFQLTMHNGRRCSSAKPFSPLSATARISMFRRIARSPVC